MNKPEISIVIPAMNEERVIGTIIKGVKSLLGDRCEIIVIDDGSKDSTGKVAKEAGAKVVTHPYNIGNGAAIKSGIRAARGEIILMMDADGQHKSEDIPRLLEKIDTYDMVIGAR